VKVAGEPGALDRSARMLQRLAGTGLVPELYGVLEEDGAIVATVTEYLPGAVDGWTWAVDDLLAWIDGGPEPAWPAELGALTATMHQRLAENARGAPTVLRERAWDALQRARRLRNPMVDARREWFERLILDLPDDPRGPVFPIHGDLHVGQVLRSGAGLRVIDFDGDPTLPIQERDRPDTAARDVAHLMSSFEMTASIVHRRLGSVSVQVAGWVVEAQARFLDAYRAGADDLLDERLLPALHAEQLLRELIYAERFLPRWRYAAEGAIAHRYPIPEEEPWTPPASLTT
jgi:maltokinase